MALRELIKPRLAAVILMVLAATLARFLPHPPNFTPVAAIALFGGCYLPSRLLSSAVVIVAMLLSDAVLGFHPLMPVVYLSLIAAVFLGWTVRSSRSPRKVIALSLISSVLFFVATNFAEWAMGILYPRTLDGLVACFTFALPFFNNSLFGDLFFTAMLFGGFSLLEQQVPALRERPAGLQAAFG